jgi:hypothetical protein
MGATLCAVYEEVKINESDRGVYNHHWHAPIAML